MSWWNVQDDGVGRAGCRDGTVRMTGWVVLDVVMERSGCRGGTFRMTGWCVQDDWVGLAGLWGRSFQGDLIHSLTQGFGLDPNHLPHEYEESRCLGQALADDN
jgi:hypothetical protein